MAIIATFKRRLDENKGEQEELMFFKQGLRYLLAASGQQVDINPWTVSWFDVDFREIIGAGGL